MIEDEDELSKKRRLAPASEHQLAAEKHAQDFLDAQLDTQQRDRQRPHRLDYAALQLARTQEVADRRAIEEADRYLEERSQQAPAVRSTEPQTTMPGRREEQDQADHRSPELARQQERMTQEERRRHEAFTQGSELDERAALQAARVIRTEYERRKAPELGAIRTRFANEENERHHRLSEENPHEHDQSPRAQGPDAGARQQDQQQKDVQKQETLREQGSEAPPEQLQEMQIAKGEVQRRQSSADRYETTREERQEVEKLMGQQQSRGMTCTR